MANPWAGEVEVTLDGVAHRARLTLGALAELEETLEAGGLLDLIERFETRRFTSRDVLALILAGLRGGGWQGRAEELRHADIAGGPLGAAQVAALLLTRAFALPPGKGEGP